METAQRIIGHSK